LIPRSNAAYFGKGLNVRRGKALDPGELRVRPVGQVNHSQLLGARLFDPREPASAQQILEITWPEQAEKGLTPLLGLGHGPLQSSGGQLAQLGLGNDVGDDEARACRKRRDQLQHLVDRGLSEVLCQRDRGNDGRSRRVESRVGEWLTQAAAGEVDRDIGDGGRNRDAHLVKPASLPRLGRRAVDLEDRQASRRVWPPVRKRVQTSAKNYVLVEAIPDGQLDRILDEARPDCECKAKGLARRLWELGCELSKQRGTCLAGQPERQVVRQKRPVALAVNGAAHCRKGRRMPGPGFDFLQMLLHVVIAPTAKIAVFPPLIRTTPSWMLRIVRWTPNEACVSPDRVGAMQPNRPTLMARISTQISASADLNQVIRWLIERQSDPMILDARHLPALGRGSRLRVARPVTAPRAVLCALWLVEELDAGVCLLAGHLRFVAHPTAPEIKVSFDGHARPQIGDATLQLLELIAASIKRLGPLARVEIAPVRAPMRAAG
jgi:hypothetical protein